MSRLIATLIVFALFAGNLLLADEVRLPDKLPVHPRLFLTPTREAEIKSQRASDPFRAKLVDELIAKADRAKNEPVTDYKIPDGKRLLAQSRRSLERTTVLAFAYRMTGDASYADKAVEEMLAVCGFKDWNPSHFLDTAEMATAVGIGYDWLYDFMPSETRDEIRAALVKHALKTAQPLYRTKTWWVAGNNNWNEVCNAGMTIAALAIAEDEPALAGEIVNAAIKSLPSGLTAYAPDGAYPEGPSYWNYGASFTGLMLRAVGDVFDVFGEGKFAPLQNLLAAPGMSATGDYVMSIVGPLERTFNYADGGDSIDGSPMMFALATWYGRADYAVWLREFMQRRGRYAAGRLAVFHAIWYTPAGTTDDFAATPVAKVFRGVQDVMTMRTAWNDPLAAFVGFKGGNNRANHGHLDIGAFVYDCSGVRWAVELGPDDYNMPGYFGRQRWDYFRLNNRSHNTLTIADAIQNPVADCKIAELIVGTGDVVAKCRADITQAYESHAKKVVRTVTLLRDKTFIVEDELDGVTEDVRWAMVTAAKIEIDSNRATLTQDNKTLVVELDSPNATTWSVASAKPPTEKERQNDGFSILAAVATPQEGNVRIRITMRPQMQ